ncbi:MAG: hypothetical protein Q7V05_11350 [Methanoregula sp.]|nr:hypothetical protein [Methanoregula sp.]
MTQPAIRDFSVQAPKTALLFTFHLLQLIRQAIGHPKGAVSALFRAQFMPNQAEQGSICVFPKIIRSIFREFGTFWEP